MEEEENMETMDLNRPRKLNFNAPLLSTRRLGCSVVGDASFSSNSLGTVQNTRVPFSWEQAPGKAKDIERSDSTHDGGTPRPRLPPCLWHPLKEAAEVDNGDFAFHDQDDGCDGDDDDDDDDGDENNNDIFSDAMDVFSLSEALDIVQKSETGHSGSNDGLRLKLAGSNGDQSPNYMINRFLPDATALAASSALHFSNNLDKKFCDNCSYPEAYLSGSARQSYASSPKGCGLQLLFPWRMKQKLCAIKSPVLPYSKNLQKHQHGSKHKKHRSSVHKPCTKMKEDI